MPEPAYRYRAQFLPGEHYDGDSFVAMVDCGFYVFRRIRVRVRDLWCPELSTPEGQVAASHAANVLSGAALIIESYKDRRSFERWICDVWLPTHMSFAAHMIESGHGSAERP